MIANYRLEEGSINQLFEELERDGIKVDPDLYPLLEKCATNVLGPKPPSSRASALPPRRVAPQRPQQQSLPPKVPQTTRS